MSDEEKHTQIMVALGEINTTLEKVVAPAVSQTYDNKDAIIILKNNAKHSTDSRSRFMGYASLIISGAVAVMVYLKLNKIH